ncbi:MAG: metal ABC transporter permease [Endomicrobium sp.]|jgi:zinc/manganese transport system permease protein|nr:metal ABC transporter permease [Endomicrobium sp.]
MMLFEYPFIFKALILCLILTGMHTYLGYHIVKRGVIFVDLALAQIAALGGCAAALAGFSAETHPALNYLVALCFTLLGAVLFSFFRSKKEKVPIEALIGITYAGAIALSLIILERSATGSEEIKEMLSGSILTVSSGELLFITVLYAVIGAVHFVFRKKFIAVTNDHEAAAASGVNIMFWDILFYATFGFIVTSSVKIAGVMLVFSFLIIPSVAAAFAAAGTVKRIVFGWIFGITGCVLGLETSLRLDWTPGASIVAAFLALLCAVIFIKNKTGVFNGLDKER